MQYVFKSRSHHNLQTVITRYLPKIIWPFVLTIAVELVFPLSGIAKNNFHFYTLLFIEAGNLYAVLTDDSVNEILIDTVKRSVQFSYYNIYEGEAIKSYPFSLTKVNLVNNRKGDTSQIDFYTKKTTGFKLNRKKDNFSQQDMDALEELLRTITSQKEP
jgi:hypothetical protein